MESIQCTFELLLIMCFCPWMLVDFFIIIIFQKLILQQPVEDYTKLGFYGQIRGFQLMFIVIHIPVVLIFVGYLKWKFKLFSTQLCSVINVGWVENIFISVGCLDINWKSKRKWFCKGEVRNKIAVTLQRRSMFLSSIIWLLAGLPETPVCMDYGRFLFDRGKKLDSVVMSLYFPIVSLLVVSLEWKCAINGDAQLNRVIMCNSAQVGETSRSIFTEFSSSTLRIKLTGEVKIGFEVCTGTFMGLAKFLEFSSSFVFDKEKLWCETE
ncbi:hypothetical protein MKX03_027870 [Papaver bracteatum]|nr:hypothetical protein MKX03_027870 [Papaver bracteatum]